MELIAEISRLKRINSELIELLDHLVRKQVQLEHEQKKRIAAPLSQPKPEKEKLPSDTKRLWVRAGDICRSKKNPDSLLPISAASWFRGVKEGRYPQPKKLGRMSLWRYEDIRNLTETT